MRVISLVPSITETLLAWSVDVVACTRFCEQPQLPHVGGTKNPDLAAIAALAPDLVVLDREENRREDADALASAGLACHVTHVLAVGDVDPELRRLAEAVGVIPPARSETATGWRKLGDRPAFVPIWRRPWMTISSGTYGSSVLAELGITNVFGDHPDRYPEVDLESVARLQPHLVLIPSEPYAFDDRHEREIAEAIPAARLCRVDGRDLFWWGVRTPGALRRLADQLDAGGGGGRSASP